MQLCVIAKEPRPGFAKTRLCPPCTPDEAAAIAEAGLADTLEVVAHTPAVGHVLALDGAPGAWLPSGVTVVEQCRGGLDQRLAAAFAWCFAREPHEPVVLIGMDTPHVRSDDLTAAGHALDAGADAVLGPATDGGYWLIGLRQPVPDAFTAVPMSTSRTGQAQRRKLEGLGLSVDWARPLDDVDSFDDAARVAGLHPRGRFAAVVRRVAASVHALS